MAELNQQIAAVAGQPSSVRVGTVIGINPLVISLQGAEVMNVGVLPSYAPQLNDTVILLGQSSNAGSDPASWLALGSPTPSGLRTFRLISDTTFTMGADQIVSGTSVTFTTTAPSTSVHAWWTGDFNVVGAVLTTAVLRPIIDGVAQNQVQAILETPVAAAVGRWTLGNQTTYGLPPGDHTIALLATAAPAGNVSLVAGSTGLLLNVYG